LRFPRLILLALPTLALLPGCKPQGSRSDGKYHARLIAAIDRGDPAAILKYVELMSTQSQSRARRALAGEAKKTDVGDLVRQKKELARAGMTGIRGLADTLQSIDAAITVSATNLANAKTVGYKRRRVFFRASGIFIECRLDMSAGKYKGTSRTLDCAILGKGFFQLTLPSGETGYTRDGSFHIDANRDVVNADGYKISSNINVPADAIDVNVGRDGTMQAIFSDQDPQDIGQLELATFPSPEGLQAADDRLFRETTTSGAPTTGNPGQGQFGGIRSGYLEGSNVNAAREMITIMELSAWNRNILAAIEAYYRKR
jgi:flagellar basal body rod protein FlgG